MPQVSGRCIDASGAPVPGVFVYAAPAAGVRFGKAPGTHSRRDGRWVLDLAAGQWTVRETGHATHDVHVADAPVSLDANAVALVPALDPPLRRPATATSSSEATEEPSRVPRDGGRRGVRRVDAPVEDPAEAKRPPRTPRDGGRAVDPARRNGRP